jgi:hypothetical protein
MKYFDLLTFLLLASYFWLRSLTFAVLSSRLGKDRCGDLYESRRKMKPKTVLPVCFTKLCESGKPAGAKALADKTR